MKSMTRRSLAVVLAILMVFSTMMVGMVTANGATQTTVYFDNSTTKWTSVNCYYWGGEATAPSWPGTAMTKGTGDTWSITLPATPTSVIFNNGSTQSADLTYPGDGYTATPKSTSSKFEVTWSKDGQAATEPTTTDYYVAGEAGLCGVAWSENAAANKMTANADGSYEKVYSDVAAGTYKFKITNGTWNNALSNGSANDNDGNSAVTVAKAGSTVTIKLTSDKQVVSTVTEPATEATEASDATEATQASDATEATEATQAGDTRTILFTNNQQWAKVMVYTFKKVSGEGVTVGEAWPGVEMTKGDENFEGSGVYNYSAEISKDAEFIIFHNGSGTQTDDLELTDAIVGFYYDDETKTYKFWSNEPETQATDATDATQATDATDATTATDATDATEATEATEPVAETYKVTFTNNQNWAKVYVYAYDGKGGQNAAWPGVEMTDKVDNGYEAFNYSYNLSVQFGNVVFNDGNAQGGEQTVDIEYDKTKAGYYPTEKDTTTGKWNVDSWSDAPVEADYTATYTYTYDGVEKTVVKTFKATTADEAVAKVKANAPKVDNPVATYALDEASIKAGEGNTYTATLTATAKKYTVTLDGTEVGEYEFNELATVTSDTETMFIVDGNNVCKGTEYSFYVTKDTDVTTDATKTDVDNFVTIANTATITNGDKVTVELLATASNDKFQRMGVVFYKDATKTENDFIAAVNEKKVAGTAATYNKVGVYTSTVTEPNESGLYQFIYTPSTSNKTVTLYYRTFVVDTDGAVSFSDAYTVDYSTIVA